MQRLLEFAAVQGVDRVVSVDGYPSRAQLRSFGATERVGGAVVAPACGRSSLASRDLTAYVKRYDAELAGQRRNLGYCRATYFYELPRGPVPGRPARGRAARTLRRRAGAHVRAAAEGVRPPRLRAAGPRRAGEHDPYYARR